MYSAIGIANDETTVAEGYRGLPAIEEEVARPRGLFGEEHNAMLVDFGKLQGAKAWHAARLIDTLLIHHLHCSIATTCTEQALAIQTSSYILHCRLKMRSLDRLAIQEEIRSN